MPETMLSRPVEPLVERTSEPPPRPAPADLPTEFDYRPMPVLAPVSFCLGLVSLLAFLGLFGIFMAFVGMLVGGAAVWVVRQAAGQYSGSRLAALGLALSAVCFFTGSGLMYRDYIHELPEGYFRVNFPHEISARKFVAVGPHLDIPPEVKPLEGQKVFLKGWMWNTQTGRGLTRFVLLKDNGKCCMGGDPAPYDMMDVQMQNGLTVDYRPGMVAVGGILRMDISGPNRGEAVYVLEADHFARAKTSF